MVGTRGWLAVMLFVSVACGGDDDGGSSDAGGGDTGASACSTDSDCSDGLFCNGLERCAMSRCVAGPVPCEGMICLEAEARCDDSCPDADGDGYRDAACGGTDCDDADDTRSPGVTEVCDVDDRDEDCDPGTFGVRDADGDGYPDAACCNGANCGSDCDDAFAGAHPGLAETCDAADNDCDGTVDETVLRSFYPDVDGDLAGDALASPVLACNPPPDHVENDADCDDGDAAINPTAQEVCEAGCDPGDTDCVDENCDGASLSGDECECTVGETTSCCSGRGTRTCEAGTGTFGACSVMPVAEACNGIDDDCDGTVDEDAVHTCYLDADRDGLAAAGAETSERCVCEDGWTERAPTSPSYVDCNDDDPEIRPGATEACDTVDSNCDGIVEDKDRDGFAAIGADCVGGVPRTDCNDFDRNQSPGINTSIFYLTPGDPRGCGGVSGVDCWDLDCSGRVVKSVRTPAPTADTCATFCDTESFCRAQGFIEPYESIPCGTTARIASCGNSCAACLYSETTSPMGCR
ncbi:MAG: putative metal-binding motif-containing protein [Sandaracinus sp.]|nr:putative metal-binding motif-containing protein [Sandaracinus sp.]